MTQKIFQVDSFTTVPYKGNPAGVCVMNEAKDEQWMQSVASEMNVAETAFLFKRGDGPGEFDLRWFTPTVEVELCGHATLASAHVMWEEGIADPDLQLRFHTSSGLLTAQREGEWIELDFPAEPAEPQSSCELDLSEALGVKAAFVGRNRFDYLVEVKDEAVLRSIAPDMRMLMALKSRGVIVTSRADDAKYDFVSRFFAPGAGVDEDPVTGSAHCCLGPFWKDRLGKAEMLGYQASPRGGEVRVRIGEKRVMLGGKAVTVLAGELKFA